MKPVLLALAAALGVTAGATAVFLWRTRQTRQQRIHAAHATGRVDAR